MNNFVDVSFQRTLKIMPIKTQKMILKYFKINI